MDYKERMKEVEEKLEKIADETVLHLCDLTNNFAFETQAWLFVEKLQKQHRTIQANVIRLLLRSIMLYAETTEDKIDPRNRGAVKACKNVSNFLKSGNAQVYIPVV